LLKKNSLLEMALLLSQGKSKRYILFGPIVGANLYIKKTTLATILEL
jgi:hypothetical protein